MSQVTQGVIRLFARLLVDDRRVAPAPATPTRFLFSRTLSQQLFLLAAKQTLVDDAHVTFSPARTLGAQDLSLLFSPGARRRVNSHRSRGSAPMTPPAVVVWFQAGKAIYSKVASSLIEREVS